MKHNGYSKHYANIYFWRTKDQKEIDYIEEYNEVLHAYEFKWNEKKITKLTKTFSEAYPGHEFTVISPENFEEFIS